MGTELGNLKLSSEVKTSCVKPSSVVNGKTEAIASMFGSHDWKVFESKPFGTMGVLVHFKCANCNADGMATLNDGENET